MSAIAKIFVYVLSFSCVLGATPIVLGVLLSWSERASKLLGEIFDKISLVVVIGVFTSVTVLTADFIYHNPDLSAIPAVFLCLISVYVVVKVIYDIVKK